VDNKAITMDNAKDNVNYSEEKITGKEWLKYSISLWDDIKTSNEKKLGHPASFPVEMIKKLIRLFTIPNDIVLDPFSGVGSTLIASSLLNRRSIGFELNESFINVTNERLKDYGCEYRVINDSCLNIPTYLHKASIDLCVTSPPYWDILNRKHSADNKPIRKYTSLQEDIGNIEDYSRYIDCLNQIFSEIYKCLKPHKMCIVIVMDIRKKNKFYPLHIDITNMMSKIGFTLEDFIIWDRRKEYNNLIPLGYPWVFRVNKVHEYICIFKKMEDI
jgi:DNA modification methylase